MPSSAPWAARQGRSSAPTALAPGSPPSAAAGWSRSPCLTALQCAKPRKALAGIRAKAAASLLDGARIACLRERRGTVHRLRPFRHLHHAAVRPAAPGRGPGSLLWSWTSSRQWTKPHLPACLRPTPPRRQGAAPLLAGPAEPEAGRYYVVCRRAAGATRPPLLTAAQWQKLATASTGVEGADPRLEGRPRPPAAGWPCGRWISTSSSRRCRALYFVGETLDCAGSCGGFNLHWAFGSGLVAGRSAAGHAAAGRALPKPPAPAKSREKAAQVKMSF